MDGYNEGILDGAISEFTVIRSGLGTYETVTNVGQSHYFYLTQEDAAYKYLAISAIGGKYNAYEYSVVLENAGTTELVVQKCTSASAMCNLYQFILKNPDSGCLVRVYHYGTGTSSYIIIGMK